MSRPLSIHASPRPCVSAQLFFHLRSRGFRVSSGYQTSRLGGHTGPPLRMGAAPLRQVFRLFRVFRGLQLVAVPFAGQHSGSMNRVRSVSFFFFLFVIFSFPRELFPLFCVELLEGGGRMAMEATPRLEFSGRIGLWWTLASVSTRTTRVSIVSPGGCWVAATGRRTPRRRPFCGWRGGDATGGTHWTPAGGFLWWFATCA